MDGTKLTLGPILFHWDADRKRDFYARIADEAPIDIVYLGEVVCSKRSPFFERHYPEVIDRLERGGKQVVLSTLAEVVLPRVVEAARAVTDARAVAMTAARRGGLTLPAIARFFGKDHTTVMHAHRKVEMHQDEHYFKTSVENLKERLKEFTR